YMRHGAAIAIVEADFDISMLGSRYKSLYGDYLKDGRLTVRREIARDGNSKVRINDDLSTVARLKELTGPIAEILGQHANQMLMSEANHLLFLDYFASLDTARHSVSDRFAEWQEIAVRLRKVIREREHLAAERELLLFPQAEIEK